MQAIIMLLQAFMLLLGPVLGFSHGNLANPNMFADQMVWIRAYSHQAKIIEFSTTLRLGEGVASQGVDDASWVVIWPGLTTEKNDLVQVIANNARNPCVAGVDPNHQWCAFAYTFEKGAYTFDEGKAVYGDAIVPVGPNMDINIHYVWDSGSDNVTQTAAVSGKVISKLSTNSGKGDLFYTAIECSDCVPITVPAHSYVETLFTLENPDPQFNHTIDAQGGTSFGSFLPTDNGVGKTWRIDWIHIPVATNFHVTG